MGGFVLGSLQDFNTFYPTQAAKNAGLMGEPGLC